MGEFGFWDGVPVTAVLGDKRAALFGQGGLVRGRAKVTWGTGAFLLLQVSPSPVPSRHGLLTTASWARGGEVHYALEGSAFVAEAALGGLHEFTGWKGPW